MNEILHKLYQYTDGDIMNYILITFIALIIFIVISVLIANKYKRNYQDIYFKYIRLNAKHNDLVSIYENKVDTLKLTNSNFKNAINLTSKKGTKRYNYIYELKAKKSSIYYKDQEIVIQFDLELYHKYINIHTLVFVDGDYFDPLLMYNIDKEDTIAEIDAIDCLKFKGRGIGTLVVQSLCKVLKDIGISTLKAKLSPVDFKVKDKLYKFYIDYNGFVLKKELEEKSWGLVEKIIE